MVVQNRMERLKHAVYCLYIFNELMCALCVFTPVVEVSQGKLRGLRSVSGQNRYYGIPYAVSGRFQPPQEPPRWNGIFNAANRFGSCAQTVSFLSLGTEDCLHLDVYSPEHAKPGDKLPVLVFIHGGAYYYGSKFHYDPEFLVVKNVVTVIINYRLGVLGFLCMNGIANLGLKDQVAALKWIQKNISTFGGDPDNVTLSGQSAGASAAAMHFLSESSKGLFHKAILMSGTSITPWAYNLEPLEPAAADAEKLGKVANKEDIHNIFANATVSDLLTSTHDTSLNSRYFKYTPCVDSNFTEPFFHDTPYNIIKSGRFNKVPIILGFTDVEGMLFYGLNNDKTFEEWDGNFVDRLPSVFSWCSESDRKKIAQTLRKHYFGTKPINKAAIKGVVDYYSDWLAYASVDAFSTLMASVSDQPIYNYMFSYVGDRNFARNIFGSRTGLKGASHSDDIFYVFRPAGLPLLLSTRDRLFIDRLTTMLTNFMKYGNPTPFKTKLLPVRWPAITANNVTHVMRLDRTLSVSETPRSHQGEFFLGLLCTYGQRGYVPCESEQKCTRQ